MKKLILILFIFASANSYSFYSDETGNFLNFSDIHFDPFYDSVLVSQLILSSYENWEDIFESSAVNTISTYGEDSNFPLLKSSLLEMKRIISDPDFIIITGDFMSHNFNEDFRHFTGIKNEHAQNLFIEKTIKFITSYITKFFPGKIIYPSVGNDDAYCGNYMIEPGGDFLKMLADAWEPWTNVNGLNPNFKNDFIKGGYCMLNLPGSNNHKMIILNTVFCSWKYKNKCGDTLLTPGKDELEWLESNLERCRRSNHKVYLSYHIPPGVDVYSTVHNDTSCSEKFFHSWDDELNSEFMRIMEEYSEIITASFAGHFHRDDFRIIYKNNLPASYINITPSISPVYDNNPSLKIFQYDKSDYGLINYQSYYLPVQNNYDNPGWLFQYDFSYAYKMNQLSSITLDSIRGLIKTDSLYKFDYIKYYIASSPKDFSEDLQDWKYNWCGISYFTKPEYTNCLCGDNGNR